MGIVAVRVQVRVESNRTAEVDGSQSTDLLEEPCQVPHAEHNQHEGDGHFHREAEPRWDYNCEEDDRAANRHDRQCMPDAPQAAD